MSTMILWPDGTVLSDCWGVHGDTFSHYRGKGFFTEFSFAYSGRKLTVKGSLSGSEVGDLILRDRILKCVRKLCADKSRGWSTLSDFVYEVQDCIETETVRVNGTRPLVMEDDWVLVGLSFTMGDECVVIVVTPGGSFRPRLPYVCSNCEFADRLLIKHNDNSDEFIRAYNEERIFSHVQCGELAAVDVSWSI